MQRALIGTSNPKTTLSHKFASVPLIPKFARECAARACELRNRDTSVFWRHPHRSPSNGGPMTAITLAQADRLIDAILARGAELDCRPLSVIVVEPGCKVKAFKKEDGSSMIRFEMAYGKAYAALAMGRSSKLVKVRAEQRQAASRFFPR